MATVTIENSREHDITLSVVTGEGPATITVPGARQNPEDRNELINGRSEADDAFLAEAKKNPVVAHYFDAGWLREAKSAAKKAAKE